MALAAIVPARADRYFSLRYDTITAVNDTLSFYPNTEYKYLVYLTAHLDGYTDQWYLKITQPSDVTVLHDNEHQITLGPAMSVPFLNGQGDSDIYNATLLTNLINQPEGDSLKCSHFASRIDIMGFWYPSNANGLQPYGTVKWPEGDHDYLLSFLLSIPDYIIDFDLTFDLTFNSTYDHRPVLCLNSHSIRNLHIHAGYMPGDVNGNGIVTIADVTMAQDFLFYGTAGASAYQIDAADVDRDGVITVADITEILDMVAS